MAMLTIYLSKKFLAAILLLYYALCNYGCTNKPAGKEYSHTKPPAGNADTCIITQPSAVFYYPDTMQLEQIKKQTDPAVFSSMMHDNSFQMNYSKNVIQAAWPQLTVTDCTNCRYLKFLRTTGSDFIIDLNNNNDAFGLYVFDLQKNPVLIDMTNLETGISFYLTQTTDN